MRSLKTVPDVAKGVRTPSTSTTRRPSDVPLLENSRVLETAKAPRAKAPNRRVVLLAAKRSICVKISRSTHVYTYIQRRERETHYAYTFTCIHGRHTLHTRTHFLREVLLRIDVSQKRCFPILIELQTIYAKPPINSAFNALGFLD
jgi:hypothetical protein